MKKENRTIAGQKKYWTIGDIARLGLLKGMDGMPYTSKITIRKLVGSVGWTEVKTKYGLGKGLTMKQIEKLNSRFD